VKDELHVIIDVTEMGATNRIGEVSTREGITEKQHFSFPMFHSDYSTDFDADLY
jgi:hypothetical protein